LSDAGDGGSGGLGFSLAGRQKDEGRAISQRREKNASTSGVNFGDKLWESIVLSLTQKNWRKNLQKLLSLLLLLRVCWH
jgi:hypothetical protein